MQSPDSSVSFEEWATRYGPAYEIPVEFGRKHIVITDPKAVIHFYNSERTVYVKTDSNRLFIGRIVRALYPLQRQRANLPNSLGAEFYGQKEICTNGLAGHTRHGLSSDPHTPGSARH
jgi:DNA integrity scanning protein DisA with diadenylate cyclase activity